MTDFSQTQKDYMNQLFNKLANSYTEKTNELKAEFKERTNELTLEIQKRNEEYENKIRKLEEENRNQQKTIIELQRKIRKNNIIIFGLHSNTNIGSNLANTVTEEITKLLEVNINISDISNIYKLGPSTTEASPIIVELVSYFKKSEILRNCWKLKGKNITIAEDLCKEDLNEKRRLQKHLKEAKSKGIQAYIRRNKIYIGEESYTLAQLESQKVQTNIEEKKPDSAPSTPNPELRQSKLVREFGLDEILSAEKPEKTLELKKASTSDRVIKKINTRSTSTSQITPKQKKV